MTPKTGELYSLGVNAYLDDNYIHLHGRRTINEVNLLWREWFDGLYADGATTGRMMVLHLHPWIMGQPWRIRHLDEVLGHICARQGVWKATGGEIIDWFRSVCRVTVTLERSLMTLAPAASTMPRSTTVRSSNGPTMRASRSGSRRTWSSSSTCRRTGRPSPTSRIIRAWITATASASGACSMC